MLWTDGWLTFNIFTLSEPNVRWKWTNENRITLTFDDFLFFHLLNERTTTFSIILYVRIYVAIFSLFHHEPFSARCQCKHIAFGLFVLTFFYSSSLYSSLLKWLRSSRKRYIACWVRFQFENCRRQNDLQMARTIQFRFASTYCNLPKSVRELIATFGFDNLVTA